MGYKTKIDWCDSSWNPVTGCKHDCKYCYARGIANRFGGSIRLDLPPDTSWRANRDDSEELKKPLMGDFSCHSNGGLHVLDEPALNVPVYPAPPSEIEKRSAPYPYFFDPTFHRYKLDQPQKWTKPRTIFVCSMADLFGEWVPLQWIREVFNACREASQHRYIFLTKNPKRLRELEADGELPDLPIFWYGSTVETYPDGPAENCWNALFIPNDDYGLARAHTFVSIEPIMGDFEAQGITNNVDWVIVGAETGNRAGKVIPERRWIENLITLCDIAETPLFMKDSLRELMGDDFKQEFPWEADGHEH